MFFFDIVLPICSLLSVFPGPQDNNLPGHNFECNSSREGIPSPDSKEGT